MFIHLHVIENDLSAIFLFIYAFLSHYENVKKILIIYCFFTSALLLVHKNADNAGKTIIAANIFTKNIKVNSIPIST